MLTESLYTVGWFVPHTNVLSERVSGAEIQLKLCFSCYKFSNRQHVARGSVFSWCLHQRRQVSFLIHTDMSYSLAGPRTVAPVAFPSLNPSPSWCRWSPLSWAGATYSHKNALSISCSLVVSPVFLLSLFQGIRTQWLHSCIYGRMNFLKSCEVLLLVARVLGRILLIRFPAETQFLNPSERHRTLQDPSFPLSRQLVSFGRTMIFHLAFDLLDKGAN